MENLNCLSSSYQILLDAVGREKTRQLRYVRKVIKQAEAPVESSETPVSLTAPFSPFPALWLCLLSIARRLSRVDRENHVAHKTDRGSQTLMQIQLHVKHTFILLWGLRFCFYAFFPLFTPEFSWPWKEQKPLPHRHRENSVKKKGYKEPRWIARPSVWMGIYINSFHAAWANIWTPQKIQYMHCFDWCPCIIITVLFLLILI